MRFSFTKMHGLGNDFVVIRDDRINLTPELAAKICDRRFGIGCDQLLHLVKPRDASADARMEIWNTDGSMAEMCGNGIRAVALFLNKRADAQKAEYRIETGVGIKSVKLRGSQVTVDMGAPVLGSEEPIEFPGAPRGIHFQEVGMGNPHAVFIVEDVSALPLETWGPAIERHRRFPERTNVEFVQVEGPSVIRARVWERGAGATLACGTGACASAVAAILSGRVKGPVQVRLPGGELGIEWAGPGTSVFMTGPAVEVFSGEAEIQP